MMTSCSWTTSNKWFLCLIKLHKLLQSRLSHQHIYVKTGRLRGVQSTVMSMIVCVCVCAQCVHSYILKIVWPNFTKFSVHLDRGYVSLPQVALWYVTYFGFCEWHHIFTQLALRYVICIRQWHDSRNYCKFFSMVRPASTPRRLYTQEKSAICDFLVTMCTIFTVQCYASEVYAVVMCLSVCVSVCLSHSSIASKRLNIESYKQCHTNTEKSRRNSNGVIPTGATNAGGVG